MNDSGEALYLYCLARAELLPALEELAGLDDCASLSLLRYRDLVAITSPVAPEEFRGPAAEVRLKDIAWVGPRACRHEKVVEGIMQASPVLPARFGTIFTAAAGLEQLLAKHHATIAAFLDRVTERREWSVKGYLDRARAIESLAAAAIAGQAEVLAPLAPGRRYFQEQRLRAEAEKHLPDWLEDRCDEVAADLRLLAAGVAERQVLSREATGMKMDMLLNWAFLIGDEAMEEFRARVERANLDHDHQGLCFALSGPWPPYSFCPVLD